MKGSLSAGLAVAAVAAALCAACAGSPAAPPARPAGTSGMPPAGVEPAAQPPIPGVEATRGEAANATLRLPTHLFVEKDVSVLTRRSGIVSKIHADRGDRVKRGDLLCELESRDLQLALDVARLELDKARAALDRAKRLGEEKAISREALENAGFDLRGAERAADMAEHELDKALVRAPFDGIVSARNVEAGQVLAEEDDRVLFRVTSRGPLLARLYIPSWALGHVRQGGEVALLPESAPDQPAQARIRWINDVLDAASGSTEAIAEVSGAPPAIFRPGLGVLAELRLALPPGRLTVPRAAVRGGAGSSGEAELSVMTALGGEERKVRIGFRGDDRVEILEGLEAGERVILPR